MRRTAKPNTLFQGLGNAEPMFIRGFVNSGVQSCERCEPGSSQLLILTEDPVDVTLAQTELARDLRNIISVLRRHELDLLQARLIGGLFGCGVDTVYRR